MKKILFALIIFCSTNCFSQNEIITPSGQPLKIGLYGVRLSSITSDSAVGVSNGKVLTVDNTGLIYMAPQGSSAGYWAYNAGAISFAGAGLTNVGVGTTTPIQKLHVNGNINIESGALMIDNVPTLSITGTANTMVGKASGIGLTTGYNNTFLGHQSGSITTTGFDNTFFGAFSGKKNTIGRGNLFIGTLSGSENIGGIYNSFIGVAAGRDNTSGSQNVFMGYATGALNTTGQFNVFLGNSAGNENSTGKSNTYAGYAGFNANTIGERNVSLGALAGCFNILGSGNVFLGHRAGYTEMGSNKLYISNTETTTPLIYGDFSTNSLVLNGKIGAATSNFPTSVVVSTGPASTSNFQLFVKGGILTEQLIVSSGWADYVFDNSYKLLPLSEVESFIKTNGHLPNVPSAITVEKMGLNVGDMTRIQQEKIEELTLYIIQLEKQINKHNSDMEELKDLVKEVISVKVNR